MLLNSIPLHGGSTLWFTHSPTEEHQVAWVLGNYELSCYNHSHASFCVDVSLVPLDKDLRVCLPTARSYSETLFSFVRNWQTVFQSSYTLLHSHQQRMRAPVVSHAFQQLSVFWILVILKVCIFLFLKEINFVNYKAIHTCGSKMQIHYRGE